MPRHQAQEKRLVFYMFRVAAAAAIIGVIGTFIWVQKEVQLEPIISQNIEKTVPIQEETDKTIVPEVTDNQASTKNTLLSNNLKKKKREIIPPKPIASIPSTKSQSNGTVTGSSSQPEEPPLAYAEEEITPATEELVAQNIEATDIANETKMVEDVPDIKPSASSLPPQNETIAEADLKEEIPSAEPAASPLIDNAFMAKKERRSKARKAESSLKINYYVGAVKNDDGQPLNEVKIIGLNSPFKTETKLSGDFILKADTPLTRIAVARDGFHTRKININQYTDFLNVVLVKKSTKISSFVDDLEMVTLAPKPDGGLKSFYNYLKENLQFPPNTKERGMEREVEIRFFIDENGTPTDLKVSNPDIYGFDKEAKRLLENGPKWQPFNSHAKYYIPFELE